MICRICSEPMELDALVLTDARRSLDPGMPAPVVMKCRNGHSERLDPAAPPDPQPSTFRGSPCCAVCGVEIPRAKGVAPRKSCSPEHKRFVEVQRAEAVKAHKVAGGRAPFRFIIEAQPWYRGTASAFQPIPGRPELVLRSGPDFPEIPADWLEGFRRIYPEVELAPALVGAFPALEDLREGEAPSVPRRRRGPARKPTAEQLMPYPVPHV